MAELSAAELSAVLTEVRVVGDDLLVEAVRSAVDVPVRQEDGSAKPPGAGISLTVAADRLRVRIGPLLVPGTVGCGRCVATREDRNQVVLKPHQRAAAQDTGPAAPPVVGAPVRDVVTALLTDEVRRLAVGSTARTAGAVLDVSTTTAEISRHPFLPDPCCPECGDLPPDTPQAAMLPLGPRPKAEPDHYRIRRLGDEHAELTRTLVDAKTGVIASLAVRHHGPMVVTEALSGPVCCTDCTGYARTLNLPDSVAVSIAETLDRLGGMRARARRTSVHASFRELGTERAVDPDTLGLSTTAPAGQRYDPEVPMEWVYAYSFRRDEPVLVPEFVAYFGAHATFGGLECSNGCAIGGTLEEAILHGIFEIAERDAALATWLTRRPARRVNPHSTASAHTRLLLAWLERSTGSRVRAFDITMPEGVPSLWLMLVDERDRPAEPKVFSASGAHLDPERALRSALVELAGEAERIRLQFDPRRADRLVDHGDAIVKIDDHAFAAAAPRAWPRFAFLDHDGEIATMAEAFPPAQRHQPGVDQLDDLRHTVERYLSGGTDVVVVDQSAAEHRAANLHAVKVVIPGTIPMAFGHDNRRLGDRERLLNLPVRLGHRTEPLHVDDLNPHPHPFL
ncbi:TOMM precursor leader peptide-binding protein [Micromonospora sp. NPDC000316]|uniref:TOMM precursor leader peptide-binding protein n=1 Tax=Micromonospora sp. NPDC000316 TaxID=3364216 RepID=UPI00369768E2